MSRVGKRRARRSVTMKLSPLKGATSQKYYRERSDERINRNPRPFSEKLLTAKQLSEGHGRFYRKLFQYVDERDFFVENLVIAIHINRIKRSWKTRATNDTDSSNLVPPLTPIATIRFYSSKILYVKKSRRTIIRESNRRITI